MLTIITLSFSLNAKVTSVQIILLYFPILTIIIIISNVHLITARSVRVPVQQLYAAENNFAFFEKKNCLG